LAAWYTSLKYLRLLINEKHYYFYDVNDTTTPHPWLFPKGEEEDDSPYEHNTTIPFSLKVAPE
jgi:hypothetical protein